MKKQLFSAALLAAVLLAVGCNDTETPAENDPTSETGTITDAAVTEIPDAVLSEQEQYPLPEVDMNGMPLRFLNYIQETLTWALIDQDVDAENGESINDEIFRRNSCIEAS